MSRTTFEIAQAEYIKKIDLEHKCFVADISNAYNKLMQFVWNTTRGGQVDTFQIHQIQDKLLHFGLIIMAQDAHIEFQTMDNQDSDSESSNNAPH